MTGAAARGGAAMPSTPGDARAVPSTPTPPHSDDEQRRVRAQGRKGTAEAPPAGAALLLLPPPPVLDEQCFSPGELSRSAARGVVGRAAKLPLHDVTVPLLDAASVDVLPPLAPNELSGVCCPAATAYNHQGFSELRRTWPLFALMATSAALLLAVLVADAVLSGEVGAGRMLPEERRSAMHALLLRVLLLEGLLWASSAAFFFCAYRPAHQLAPRPPTLLGKLLCPVPTVFYHEGNDANETCCGACFCGPFYTFCCWTPYYMNGARELV
jgi:hypothetical protein